MLFAVQAEKQLLGVHERALGLERDVAALREADRVRTGELRQASEVAGTLRAERDRAQERLSEVQDHLSRAVADSDRFRAQVRAAALEGCPKPLRGSRTCALVPMIAAASAALLGSCPSATRGFPRAVRSAAGGR